jgi:DNA-binding NarL/FixJ family response regulator
MKMADLPAVPKAATSGNTLLAGARLLVIDDDGDLLGVLGDWFSLFCAEVHTAADGATALAIAKRQPLDVVLTDLRMPGFDGLQLLALLKAVQPDLVFVFLTGQGTMEDAIVALREGRAFDFLQKPVRDFNELNLVLERALASRPQPAAPAAPAARTAMPPAHGEVDPLTSREIEVVALLAQGLDNRQIGDRLVLSEKTVKNHLTRIYEKLRVSNRVQAVMVCQGLGVI